MKKIVPCSLDRFCGMLSVGFSQILIQKVIKIRYCLDLRGYSLFQSVRKRKFDVEVVLTLLCKLSLSPGFTGMNVYPLVPLFLPDS